MMAMSYPAGWRASGSVDGCIADAAHAGGCAACCGAVHHGNR